MSSTDANRREGRGRLSSIDLLPEECEPDIVWALEQLREHRLPSNAILEEFNERLADRGLEPISKSAWGRYSVRKAIQFKKLDNAQRMAGELVESLGTEGPDELTVAIAEMLKVASFELLEEGKLSSKGVMELSRALQSAVGAQKTSTEHRRKLEAEVAERLHKAAAAAEEAGKKGGVAADTLKKITNLLTTGGY